MFALPSRDLVTFIWKFLFFFLNMLAVVYFQAVLRIRIRDSAFSIRDPGWTMNIPDHISESLETNLWVKILKFFNATLDPESGMRYGKNSDLGWIYRIRNNAFRNFDCHVKLERIDNLEVLAVATKSEPCFLSDLFPGSDVFPASLCKSSPSGTGCSLFRDLSGTFVYNSYLLAVL